MLETLISALFTLLPDYLYRRYVQGKRIGIEITFFSVWYELRWGLVTCFVAATTIITLLFYFHPSTGAVASYYRTVTILPEAGGRVAEVYVRNNQTVEAGDPLFRLDASSQEDAVETARRKIEETEAAMQVAALDITAAQASVDQAQAAYDLTESDFLRNKELLDRGSPAANPAEVERQANRLAEREAQLAASRANLEAVRENVDILLPAQKASAEAALAQAQTELDKTLVVAGVSGRVEQLALQEGDIVNPLLRPAGILVPTDSGHLRFQAGFHQLAAQVIKPGMIAEIGCLSKPFTVIPMVVVEVQDVIPSGQFRPTDRLQDPQSNVQPGSVVAYLEPLYAGGIDDLPPGSNCIANAYSDYHDEIENEEMSAPRRAFLHVVDTIGVVHAAGIRLRMLLLPVTTLVFSSEH